MGPDSRASGQRVGGATAEGRVYTHNVGLGTPRHIFLEHTNVLRRR